MNISGRNHLEETSIVKNEDYYDDIEEFLEHLPDRFIATAEELDQATYQEYLDYKRRIHDEYYSEEQLLQQSQSLFGETISLEEKKRLLTLLAQLAGVKVYRVLERYAQKPDQELRQWSLIALYECQMRLEGDLLEQEVGLISTGLGGEGQRLRYIVVIGLMPSVLTEHQQQEIEATFMGICQHHDSQFESLEFHSQYLLARLLVSMDVAVGTVIEESIARLNQHTDVVFQDYLITNVSVPTQEEIQDYLNEIRGTDVC